MIPSMAHLCSMVAPRNHRRPWLTSCFAENEAGLQKEKRVPPPKRSANLMNGNAVPQAADDRAGRPYQLNDRDRGIDIGGRKTTAVGQPLVDQPVVFASTDGGAVSAKVEVLAIDSYRGLATVMAPVGRDAWLLGHVLHLYCGLKW